MLFSFRTKCELFLLKCLTKLNTAYGISERSYLELEIRMLKLNTNGTKSCFCVNESHNTIHNRSDLSK